MASKTDDIGVLILSEMAGAANELGEAVIINPYYYQEISEAIACSLELTEEEQKKRNQIMRGRLKKFDLNRWASDFIEEKDYSVAWHYRAANPDLGSMRAKELIANLVDFTANINVQVMHNNKVVEVRNIGLNKGVVSQNLVSKKGPDFIMAIGDDLTDEDIFKVMPEHAYTIKVGMTNSFSKFNLRNQSDVLQLLKQIAESI